VGENTLGNRGKTEVETVAGSWCCVTHKVMVAWIVEGSREVLFYVCAILSRTDRT
jgi:hypothetical protein